MPTVNIGVTAAPATPGTHKRVTLTGYNGTVTLDIASPEVEFSGLADVWVETPVPGRKPFLQRSGKPLRRISLPATVGRSGDDREADVTVTLLALIAMASPFAADRTVVLGYSRIEGHRELVESGGWIITDLNIRTVRRHPDGYPIRAEVLIELTEASFPVPPATPGSSSTPATSGAVTASGTSAASTGSASVRRHTVAAGETLWTIAAAHYGGDTSRWSAIAEANGIRDPRRLAVGAVLVLP